VQPRDIFDGLLVAGLAAVLYLRVVGPTLSGDRVDALLALLAGVDVVVYLVLAALLGAAFIGYIAVYMPRKQGS